MRRSALAFLLLGCAPASIAAPPDVLAPDAPALQDSAPDKAPPPDTSPDSAEVPPSADAPAAVDAPPDARPATLVARVSLIAPDYFDVTAAQCSSSGWGTAAGVAATFRIELAERAPRTGRTRVTGAVSPGPVGSLALPEERVTVGVVTFFGDPYRAADGSERVDFESRGTFRTQGPVTITVTGCPVGL